MNVEFDWRFVDNDVEFEECVRKPTDVIQDSLMTHKMHVSHVRTGKLWRGTWPTPNQRRLHAAFARIEPWYCPGAEPERFTQRKSRRRASKRGMLRLGVRHLRQPRGELWLTRRQQRLHAALARTRPWLCPEARPE
jgi:hypothetical protein